MLPPQLSSGVTLKGLHWQGRTFDVAIGAASTKVTLRGGGAFTLETPAGTQAVSSSATIATRRPDLTAVARGPARGRLEHSQRASSPRALHEHALARTG